MRRVIIAAMSDAAPLDVFTCPLDGIRLIEASAGTGKTWSICALYLRLLIERELDIERVLVVTFTRAATAELSARIRERIVDTLRVLDGGACGADPFVPDLLAAAARAGQTPAALQGRLRHALQVFDEAAIFTIHGFCQRVLADTPFAAALPYALELVEDDSALRREVAEDFWRRRVAGAALPALLARELGARGDCPQRWAGVLQRYMARPCAQALWDAVPADALERATVDLEEAWAALPAAAVDEAVAALAAPAVKLHRSTYKPEAILAAARQWRAWLASGDPAAPLPPARERKLQLLAASMLAEKSTGGAAPPAHPFFAAAQTLLTAREACEEAVQGARQQLLRAFVDEAAADLRARKLSRRQIAFDDILWNAREALSDGARPWLAADLHARYPVALIDEFQDTDPLQLAIFSSIYQRPAARGTLFLVGDPKQAIYSFRSADLFTYLQARSEADARYALAHNQRSAPALIDACNRLFAANPALFMLPGLDYVRVAPGSRQRPPLTDAGSSDGAALRLWQLPPAADDPERRLSRAQALERGAAASAAEIARLLDGAGRGEVRIGERALLPQDIAVLVRSHRQGALMRRALGALGVGSVELAQASVYLSAEAEELERVLLAIAEPGRAPRVLAALATVAMGRDAATLAALAADERRLPEELARFARWREIWLSRGFAVMLRRWMVDDGVAARLLGSADGERRLTNLMHLAELLQQDAGSAAPEALLRTLAARRGGEGGGEAAQLRLESDRNLVHIVTIHRAKGLEYGVVFCPFLFDGHVRREGDEGLRAWHGEDGRLFLDARRQLDDDEAQAVAARIRLESAAEDLRLIYVALTRAVYRCYLVVGCYGRQHGRGYSHSESTRSLLNWMVAGSGCAPGAWFDGRPAVADIEAAWQALAGAADSAGAPAISIATLAAGNTVALPPAFVGAAQPEALVPPPLPAGWRIGSFSALIFGASHEQAARDHDAHAGTVVALRDDAGAQPEASDILRFPRGPAAGDCIHAVFERLVFTAPESRAGAIARALAEHPQSLAGVSETEAGPRLQAMLAGMVDDVLAAEIVPGLRLGSVPATRCSVELGFHLPAPQLDAAALNAWLATHGYDMPQLSFAALSGYLKGYIDLVFEHDGRYWVADWKSNHLGDRVEDYAAPALDAAMRAHGYHLQHLIYTLAVHRHLRRALPDYDYERDFGGVLYLFVRGVRPHWRVDGAAAGVWRHRPAAAVIAAFDALVGAVSTPVADAV